MAIQLLPLLLIGAGAVAIATRKKMGIPIGATSARWLKVYPVTGIFDDRYAAEHRDLKDPPDMDSGDRHHHEMLARSIWMKAAKTVRAGDVIEVAPEQGAGSPGSTVPSVWAMPGRCLSEFDIDAVPDTKPTKTAWYVVTSSPKDHGASQNGREVLLQAKLIMGHGPKIWTIYERSGAKDTQAPPGGNLATRLPPIMMKREAFSGAYSEHGEVMFPEILTIGRDKKTIFSQKHRRKDGAALLGSVWLGGSNYYAWVDC